MGVLLWIALEDIEELTLVLWISAELHGPVVLVRGRLLIAVVKGKVVVLSRPHIELL